MDYENLRLLCGHIKRKSDNTSCVVFMRTGRQSTPDFLLVSFHEDNRVEYYHYFKSSIDAYNAYVRKAEGGRAREVGSKESSAMSYFLKEGGSSVRARDPIAIEETMGLIHTRRFFVEHRLQNWAKAWDERALEQKANAAIEQAGRKAVEKLDNLAKEAFFKSENPPMTLIGASLVTGNDMSCLSMWANDKGEIKILAGTGSIIYQGHSLNEAKGAAFNHINTRLALAEREGRVRLIDQLRQHQLPISNMFDGFYINRNQVVISEFAQELRAVGVYDSLLVSLPGNCRDEMDRQDLRNTVTIKKPESLEFSKEEQNVPLIEEGTLKYFSYKDSRVKKWAGSGVYGWIKDEWVALNTTEHCFKDISAESPLELIRVMNLPANVTGAWLSHKKKVLSRYCVNDIQPPPVPEPAEEPRINASHGQDKLWDETPPTEQELWEFLQARKLDILPENMHFYELAERKYTTVAKPEPTPQDINATHPPLFQGRPLTKAEASLLDKYKAEIEEAEELQVVKAMEEALNNQRKEAEMQAKELQEAKGRLSKIRKGQKKKAAIVQTMSLSAMATLMVYLIISRVFGRPVPALKLNAPNKLKKKRRRRDHQEEGPVREAIALPPAKGEEIPTRSRRRTKSKA